MLISNHDQTCLVYPDVERKFPSVSAEYFADHHHGYFDGGLEEIYFSFALLNFLKTEIGSPVMDSSIYLEQGHACVGVVLVRHVERES